MHALDAAGRRVSLLNEDSHHEPLRRPSYQGTNHIVSQPHNPFLVGRSSPLPHTLPQLLRSDSYDSQMSSELPTPLTPVHDYSGLVYISPHDTHSPREDYLSEMVSFPGSVRRHSTLSNGRSSSYDDDVGVNAVVTKPPSIERSSKRYPCRFRESHCCEKTFTTSGHASRHSKIHTAEKAVQCTFEGCTKKFTRADNMKQHLETHFKDKSRCTRPSLSSERRSSSMKTVKLNRRAPTAAGPATAAAATVSSCSSSSQHSPLSSPFDTWDMGGLQLPILGRSSTRTPSSGLDALAMAVACQEGVLH